MTDADASGSPGKMESFTVRIEAGLLRRLRAMAELNRRSVSAQAAVYIERGLATADVLLPEA